MLSFNSSPNGLFKEKDIALSDQQEGLGFVNILAAFPSPPEFEMKLGILSVK